MLKSSLAFRTGFSTGLFFTLCFIVLGDSLFTSLGLGILSGWSVGCLVKWWQIDQKPEQSEPFEIEVITDNLSDILVKSKLLPPQAKSTPRPTQATTLLGWMFKRNKD
ncbi:hypothetical protein [Planktothrix sp. FACHB-1365]|uniref:hypothetical protein n=1 Tax=Planktothrix sp. FACHB-1365 TaxID=2692855 RepID=UPI00168531B6|nr:hypothetical protein [Planktothrix sp. FACHB-1365]MBD2482608.1 hypothetical protein [Planktothrix sp. FACHB-1365]